MTLRSRGAVRDVRAKPTRIGANSLAVTFDTVAPAFTRTIEKLRTASYDRRRILSIVLVDADAERRAELTSGFRASIVP